MSFRTSKFSQERFSKTKGIEAPPGERAPGAITPKSCRRSLMKRVMKKLESDAGSGGEEKAGIKRYSECT